MSMLPVQELSETELKEEFERINAVTASLVHLFNTNQVTDPNKFVCSIFGLFAMLKIIPEQNLDITAALIPASVCNLSIHGDLEKIKELIELNNNNMNDFFSIEEDLLTYLPEEIKEYTSTDEFKAYNMTMFLLFNDVFLLTASIINSASAALGYWYKLNNREANVHELENMMRDSFEDPVLALFCTFKSFDTRDPNSQRVIH